MERRVLTELMEVHDLPTLPEVVMRIVEETARESSSASDLTLLLEKDHAISARVLRLANSAFFGLRYRVESIRRAVVVLGFDAVSELALATSVFSTLSQREQFALDPEDFWMHAFGAGKAAQLLAEGPCAMDNAESCFTAALLHDIGKYVMAIVLKGEYRDIVRDAMDKDVDLREVERQKLGFDHAGVGQWIEERWRFAASIIDTTGSFYDFASYSGPYRRELAVVIMADRIARHAQFGRAGDRAEPLMDPVVLGFLALSRHQVIAVQEELEGLRDETRSFLELLKETG